jgi:hypothetical protein
MQLCMWPAIPTPVCTQFFAPEPLPHAVLCRAVPCRIVPQLGCEGSYQEALQLPLSSSTANRTATKPTAALLSRKICLSRKLQEPKQFLRVCTVHQPFQVAINLLV